jgi:hypothetical protein
MAVVGIQALSHKELIILYFYNFQKVKHPEFSVTRNKINSSSDLFHIMSVNYLYLA